MRALAVMETALRVDDGAIDDETAEERRRRAAAEFRAGVAGGDYRGLFDQGLAQIMAQAGRERGLGDEIGALRVALARLLAEEEDAGKLALGIARITSAAARAARAQQALMGDPDDGPAAAIAPLAKELG